MIHTQERPWVHPTKASEHLCARQCGHGSDAKSWGYCEYPVLLLSYVLLTHRSIPYFLLMNRYGILGLGPRRARAIAPMRPASREKCASSSVGGNGTNRFTWAAR